MDLSTREAFETLADNLRAAVSRHDDARCPFCARRNRVEQGACRNDLRARLAEVDALLSPERAA